MHLSRADQDSLRALVEYDPSDLQPASSLVSQILPQCPPDLTMLDGDVVQLRQETKALTLCSYVIVSCMLCRELKVQLPDWTQSYAADH